MTPGERAFWADEVVKVTADAFEDVEHKLMRQVLSATNADAAWNGLLAYRALMEVRRQLNSYVDTGKLEREAATRRAAD
jgi:hypothetical protein